MNQQPPDPMLALLLAPTPEGYGTGLEPMIYISLLAPVLVLAAIWWLGSKRTV